MKRKYIYGILVLILVQAVFTPFYFILSEHLLKAYAMRQIEKSTNLMVLHIDEKEFDLIHIVEQHEIEFKGEMYDIKSMELENGYLSIIAYHDVEEKTIYTLLRKYIGSKKHDTDQKVITFNCAFFFKEDVKHRAVLLPITVQRYSQSCFFYTNPPVIPFSPPPDCIVEI